MNVLVEKIAPGNFARRGEPKEGHGVHKAHLRATPPIRRLTDEAGDGGIRTHREGVGVPRSDVGTVSRFPGAQRLMTASHAEGQLGEGGVDGCRLLVSRERLREVFGGFKLPALREQRRPLGLPGGGQIRAMEGREGRAVLQITGHGGKQNGHARAFSGGKDCFQVLAKVAVDACPRGIIGMEKILREEIDSFPCHRFGARSAQPVHKGVERLTETGGFEGETGTHDRHGRSFASEHRPRPIGPDDFVVTHVQNPQIAFKARGLPCDGRDGMRIDRRDGRADNLKPRSREALVEEDFEVAPETVGGIGVAVRGGLAK